MDLSFLLVGFIVQCLLYTLSAALIHYILILARNAFIFFVVGLILSSWYSTKLNSAANNISVMMLVSNRNITLFLSLDLAVFFTFPYL